MSGSAWFTLENLKKVTGDRKSEDIIKSLKKKYPEKKCVLLLKK